MTSRHPHPHRAQAGQAAPWVLVAVLALAAVAALVWMLGDSPPTDDGTGPTVTDVDVERAEPDLPTPAPEREVVPVPEPEVTGGTVVGTVVDQNYRPVEGATVSALQGSATIMPWILRDLPSLGVRAPSDEGGNFELLDVPPTEQLVVRIAGEEFSITDSGPYTVRPGELTDLGTLVVQPGLKLRGAVNDQRGEPVAGAQVGLVQSILQGDWAWRDVKPSRVALSDEEGLFTIHGLRPGKFHLMGEAEGYGNGLWQGDIGLDGTDERWVNLTLYDALTVEGLVVGSPGAVPLAGCRVVAMPMRNDRGNGKVETLTADDGTFVLEGIAPGDYTIGAQTPGFRRRGLSVTLPRAKPVKLRLDKNGSISGYVLKADGRPAKSFDIQAYRHFRAHFDGVKEGPFQRVRSSDGSFTIEDLREGIYSVEVWSKGHAVTQTTPDWLDQGQDRSELIVRLDRGATLAGRVTDMSGNPVPGASVSMDFNSAVEVDIITASVERKTHLLDAVSDEIGEFRLEGVVPDTYQLRVDHPDFATHVTRDVIVAAARDNRVGHDLVLEPAGTIRGTIVDGRGLPQADARVRIYADWGFSQEVRANGRGEYRFVRLRSGDYRLSALPSKIGAVSLSAAMNMTMYTAETGDALVVNLAPGQDLSQNVLITTFD